MLRSGVLLYTAVSDVAVPSRFSSTRPASHDTAPPADEYPSCGLVLQPSVVSTRNARRPRMRTVSSRTWLNTNKPRSARSLSATRAESYGSPGFTSRARRITQGWVRTCSAFARRARNPGAAPSASRSKTLRLTTTTVSMTWADRRTGRLADRSSSDMPTARPPFRVIALFDRVNALSERIDDVPGAVVPLGKIQRRVDAPRQLSQPAGREQERAADRIGLERPAQTRDRGDRRNPPRGRAERVGGVRLQVAHPAELEPNRERVLVAFGGRRVEVVARQHHIVPAPGRVDPHPDEGQPEVGLDRQAPVPFPAPVTLDPLRVAGPGDVAGNHEKREKEAWKGGVEKRREKETLKKDVKRRRERRGVKRKRENANTSPFDPSFPRLFSTSFFHVSLVQYCPKYRFSSHSLTCPMYSCHSSRLASR